MIIEDWMGVAFAITFLFLLVAGFFVGFVLGRQDGHTLGLWRASHGYDPYGNKIK